MLLKEKEVSEHLCTDCPLRWSSRLNTCDNRQVHSSLIFTTILSVLTIFLHSKMISISCIMTLATAEALAWKRGDSGSG